MRCEDEAVDWVERDSRQLMRFTRELLSKDRKYMGRQNGGHVVNNNLQFLGEFVFERVGFDGC